MSLKAEDVTVRRGRRLLLDRVCLEVRAGELLCLLGPNGSGKSTLINVLAGDIRPDAGRTTLDDRPLDGVSDMEQARRRSVMSQAPVPAFGFTVEDVVRMGWLQHDESDAMAFGRVVRATLRECGIDHLAARAFNTLSGGEQQRVSFARALVQIWCPKGADERRYLLLDEPTSSLDLVHQQRLLSLALGRARAGVGVLAVLHDLNLAAQFADRVALLSNGRLVCCETPGRALEPGRLTELFGTTIHVEHHQALNRLVVLV